MKENRTEFLSNFGKQDWGQHKKRREGIHVAEVQSDTTQLLEYHQESHLNYGLIKWSGLIMGIIIAYVVFASCYQWWPFNGKPEETPNEDTEF